MKAQQQSKSNPQVKLSRREDKGYDVVHTLSGRLVCSFRPIFVRKTEAQSFCDMLADVDLDLWWQNGCPNDGTPQKVGAIQMQWRKETYPGIY